MLQRKHILLGVTGGIAAYKSCYLVRELVRAGAEVRVVMTGSATKFVTPLTFSALSKNEVAVDLWTSDQSARSNIGTRHIDLARWADILVIAPASAQTVGKMVHGLSDNLLTIVALACTKPIILAPTMDADMFLNETTQKNIAKLAERGCFVIPSEEGEHASGLLGPGRLPEVETIVKFIERVLDKSYQDLQKKKILVTAGPTYEAIDPVRFIGNRSSGKMGFAIANAAAQRGASVTLISGPVHLETPRNVKRVNIESAEEMYRAVLAQSKKADAVIMAAAVADYAPVEAANQKIKKEQSGETPQLALKTTPDILAALGTRRGGKSGKVLVGFSLETSNPVANAKAKLKRKNLDLIVLNSLSGRNDVFGSDTNVVTLIDRKGRAQRLSKLPKFDVANRILDRVRDLL